MTTARMSTSTTIDHHTTQRHSWRRTRIALWTMQGFLAALFVFAGSMKFVMPVEEMTKDIAWPAVFLYFIGACEVLGGLGLVLPALARIRTGLVPLAAAGLVVIMIGATVSTLAVGGGAGALFPGAVGALAGYVAYGRWQIAPHRGRVATRKSRAVLQAAA
jgi:uncharacterized membrane protein YphA (DoxX/SURF4 family)